MNPTTKICLLLGLLGASSANASTFKETGVDLSGGMYASHNIQTHSNELFATVDTALDSISLNSGPAYRGFYPSRYSFGFAPGITYKEERMLLSMIVHSKLNITPIYTLEGSYSAFYGIEAQGNLNEQLKVSVSIDWFSKSFDSIVGYQKRADYEGLFLGIRL